LEGIMTNVSASTFTNLVDAVFAASSSLAGCRHDERHGEEIHLLNALVAMRQAQPMRAHPRLDARRSSAEERARELLDRPVRLAA
jgi:hypothetical protein